MFDLSVLGISLTPQGLITVEITQISLIGTCWDLIKNVTEIFIKTWKCTLKKSKSYLEFFFSSQIVGKYSLIWFLHKKHKQKMYSLCFLKWDQKTFFTSKLLGTIKTFKTKKVLKSFRFFFLYSWQGAGLVIFLGQTIRRWRVNLTKTTRT